MAGLEASFNAAVEKKDGLEKKEAGCKIQLINAAKLIGMDMYVYVCMFIYIYIYTYMYIYKSMYKYIHVFIHIHKYELHQYIYLNM